MIIGAPEVKRKVKDINITFITGDVLPVVVDEAAGDYVQVTDEHILIFLSPKPTNYSDQVLPAEKLSIFKDKVMMFQEREREITELSPNQREELRKAFEELSSSTSRPQ